MIHTLAAFVLLFAPGAGAPLSSVAPPDGSGWILRAPRGASLAGGFSARTPRGAAAMRAQGWKARTSDRYAEDTAGFRTRSPRGLRLALPARR